MPVAEPPPAGPGEHLQGEHKAEPDAAGRHRQATDHGRGRGRVDGRAGAHAGERDRLDDHRVVARRLEPRMAVVALFDARNFDATFRPLDEPKEEATMLTKLRRASAADAVGARVRWVAAVEAYAGPDATPVDPADVRGWAIDLGIDTDEEPALDAFEHDAAAVEKCARLEVGINLLDEQITAALKPFKGDDKSLQAAIEKARQELAKLEGIENDITSMRITRGYEVGDLAASRRSAPRIFGQ